MYTSLYDKNQPLIERKQQNKKNNKNKQNTTQKPRKLIINIGTRM